MARNKITPARVAVPRRANAVRKGVCRECGAGIVNVRTEPLKGTRSATGWVHADTRRAECDAPAPEATVTPLFKEAPSSPAATAPAPSPELAKKLADLMPPVKSDKAVVTMGVVTRGRRTLPARHIVTGNTVTVEFESPTTGWIPAGRTVAGTFSAPDPRPATGDEITAAIASATFTLTESKTRKTTGVPATTRRGGLVPNVSVVEETPRPHTPVKATTEKTRHLGRIDTRAARARKVGSTKEAPRPHTPVKSAAPVMSRDKAETWRDPANAVRNFIALGLGCEEAGNGKAAAFWAVLAEGTAARAGIAL